MNIAVHKFYDNRNQNGIWFQVVSDLMGLMDEEREYYVVTETDKEYWLKEGESTNQNITIQG